VDVLSEIEIARPREHVAAFACDSDNATRWYVNIKSVVWQTPRPMAVGSRLEFDAQFLGRRLAYTYEVAEHVPGERFVMRTAQGPFPMKTTLASRARAPAPRPLLPAASRSRRPQSPGHCRCATASGLRWQVSPATRRRPLRSPIGPRMRRACRTPRSSRPRRGPVPRLGRARRSGSCVSWSRGRRAQHAGGCPRACPASSLSA